MLYILKKGNMVGRNLDRFQILQEFMLSWIQIKPLYILEKQVKWGQDLVIILDMGKMVNVS